MLRGFSVSRLRNLIWWGSSKGNEGRNHNRNINTNRTNSLPQVYKERHPLHKCIKIKVTIAIYKRNTLSMAVIIGYNTVEEVNEICCIARKSCNNVGCWHEDDKIKISQAEKWFFKNENFFSWNWMRTFWNVTDPNENAGTFSHEKFHEHFDSTGVCSIITRRRIQIINSFSVE